jgi:hypothetical protein
VNRLSIYYFSIRIIAGSYIHESSILQYLYSVYSETITRVLLFFGNYLLALRCLLHAKKHVSARVFGGRRERLYASLVSSRCYGESGLLPVSENGILKQYINSYFATRLRNIYSRRPLNDLVHLRTYNQWNSPVNQDNLIILKSCNLGNNEKGVILIKYNPYIHAFPALFDLSKLAGKYAIVLEPSWWGYQHIRFFFYLGRDLEVYIQAQYAPDFEFIRSLDSNLIPVDIGPSDWTDPEIFRPDSGNIKIYDIVMIASWSPFKRHKVLFRTLNNIKRKTGRPLKVALIGYQWDWSIKNIQELVRKYKLEEDCQIYENIPHEQVASIIMSSRISVFLSKTEGSPKALYESIFCGTPVIVHRDNKGINLSRINSKVGLLTNDNELMDNILTMLENADKYQPDIWAVANSGYINTTKLLNSIMKKNAVATGKKWTADIVCKKNSPNLKYTEPDNYKQFHDEYLSLENYLIPG